MAVQDSFQGFQKLNNFTHLYQPNASSISSTTSTSISISPSNSTPPELIILCAWAFARPKHITKYIVAHQKHSPGAAILLIQSDTFNLLWRPDRLQMPLFTPAVEAVKEFASRKSSNAGGKTQGSPQPRVLLHVFSNGGSHSAVQLAQAYRESFPRQPERHQLPLSAIVFDSCPGNTSYALSVKAISQGLPGNLVVRIVGIPLVYGFVGLCGFLHETGIWELAVSKLWRSLNDTGGAFLRPGLPRTYIYSAEDPVIEEKDVLQHAQTARQRLGLDTTGMDGEGPLSLIRTVQVIGGKHVNHMSVDPVKYWRTVQETWDRAQARA